MNLEIIQEMWEKDSKIDQVMLDESSIRIPQLHHKYLTLLSEFRLLSKKHDQQVRLLEHRKWLYYSGKAPPEEYIEQPFNHKVLKGDVIHWVQVDEDIRKVKLKAEYFSTVVHTLEEILKQIHQMSYNIKNAITWRMYAGGM